MIIKKFTASTELEAIQLAKEEFGKDAIVMNVKTMAPKGLYRLFKKKVVEVTAAMDDQKQSKELKNSDTLTRGFFDPGALQEQDSKRKTSSESAIEKKLNQLQQLIEEQMKEQDQVALNKASIQANSTKEEFNETNMECMRLIYNKLIEHEMDEMFANQLMKELQVNDQVGWSIDQMLSNVYQKIVLKLGQQTHINLMEGQTKYVFFIGPTGVGKTTTIAKIASEFHLRKKAKVGLITADTYRVAAVEQLKTYANILGIPLKVIYTTQELQEAKEFFRGYDLVLIDTAGRSHKNIQQRDDLNLLLESMTEEEKEVYLVLSATTKYQDLIHITKCYEEITNYRLIFTKLDETSSVGTIYNIKLLTKAPLSYVTYGQNVPDDMDQINPQTIAKQMLGGCDSWIKQKD